MSEFVVETETDESSGDVYTGTPEQIEPEDPPAQSLDAMDNEIEETQGSEEVGAPLTSCQKPWIELLLFDAEERPAPNAPYSIALPDGTTREGNLDERGYARIENVDLDPDDYTLDVAASYDKDGKASFSVAVIPKKDDEEEGEEEEPDGDLDHTVDFDAPWEGSGFSSKE